MGCTPCPLRPVYPAQKWIFAQCSRNAGDDGASEEMFSQSHVATGQDRAVCLISYYYTLPVPLWDTARPASSGALGSPSIDSLQTHNLAFWRRFGGSLLARISSRSRWLKIWSILACRLFSNTYWVLRKKKRGKSEDRKMTIHPKPTITTQIIKTVTFRRLYPVNPWVIEELWVTKIGADYH